MSNSNVGFNTFLDIYNTANSASTKRNTEALLNASLEQNHQIMQLRRQMEIAQEQANQIATQRLEVQLREEIARQEQKFLRKFIFTTETILEDALELKSGVDRYAFLNYDIIPIVHYIEKATEDLDNLEDKRSARQQLKTLKEKQAELKKYEKEYSKSKLHELKVVSDKIIPSVEVTEPKTEIIPPVKLEVYKEGFPKILITTVICLFINLINLMHDHHNASLESIVKYIFSNGKFLFFTFLVPIVLVVVICSNYKTEEEVERINREATAEYDAKVNKVKEELENYKLKKEKYELQLKENEIFREQKEEIEELAKSEHPEYFTFRDEVLKQLSPERFKLNA